jgi:hypothetical protein
MGPQKERQTYANTGSVQWKGHIHTKDASPVHPDLYQIVIRYSHAYDAPINAKELFTCLSSLLSRLRDRT